MEGRLKLAVSYFHNQINYQRFSNILQCCHARGQVLGNCVILLFNCDGKIKKNPNKREYQFKKPDKSKSC